MQIASSHPDLIYFGGIDSTGGTLIRQQMQQVPGLQNIPFASDDGIVTPAFASTIQPLGGGNSFATVAVVDTTTNPATSNFSMQYAAAFPNEPISVESAAAYDSANILIQAVKTAIQNGTKPPTSSSDAADAITFRTAVIAAMQSISYDGVTGLQSFDSNGDTQLKAISIYELGLNSSHNPDWIDETAFNVA
jgi:branched-chain amino acid transport system substrate-binding protein